MTISNRLHISGVVSASFKFGSAEPSGSWAWTTKISQSSFISQNSTGSDDISQKVVGFWFNISKTDYGNANEIKIRFKPGTALNLHHGVISGRNSTYKYCTNDYAIHLPLKCDEKIEDGDYIVIPFDQDAYGTADSLAFINKISNSVTTYNKYDSDNPNIGFHISSGNYIYCQNSSTDHSFDAIIESVEIRQRPTVNDGPYVHLFEGGPNSSGNGWTNHDIRIISANPTGSPLSKIRINLTARSADDDAPISDIYVGAASSATDYNWKRTPTQVTFNGSTSVTVASGAIVTSDWINVDVNANEYVMIAYHISADKAGDQISRFSSMEKYQLYWKSITTPETSNMSVSGYSARTYILLLSKIEAQSKHNSEWAFLFDDSNNDYTEGTVYKLDAKNVQDASFWTNLPTSGTNIRTFDIDYNEIPIDPVDMDKNSRKGVIFTRQANTKHKNIVFLAQHSSYSDYSPTDAMGRNAVWSDYDMAVFFGQTPVDRSGNTTPSVIGNPNLGLHSDFAIINYGQGSASSSDYVSASFNASSSDITIVAGGDIESDNNSTVEPICRIEDGSKEAWVRYNPSGSDSYVVEAGDTINSSSLQTPQFAPYVGQSGAVVASYGSSSRRIAYAGVTSGVVSDSITDIGFAANKTVKFGLDSSSDGNGIDNSILNFACIRTDSVSDGWMEYQSKVLGWSPAYCLKRLFTSWHTDRIYEFFGSGRTHRVYVPFSYLASGNWIPEIWAFLFSNEKADWSLSEIWAGYADSSNSKYKFISGTQKQLTNLLTGGTSFSGTTSEKLASAPVNLGPPQGDGILISMYNDTSYDISFHNYPKTNDTGVEYHFWRSNVVSDDDPGTPPSDSPNNGIHLLSEIWGR